MSIGIEQFSRSDRITLALNTLHILGLQVHFHLYILVH